MKNTIQTIIQNEIPKGYIFDSHSIIDYIVQYCSDKYLDSYKQGWTTELYHGYIGKTIASFEGNLIERIGDSWSLNIHKKFSENVCWKKL